MSVAELKERLDVVEVIERSQPLKRAGRKMVGIEHDSLVVDPERQSWTWFSQAGQKGKKFLGGDVLDWLAHGRFGRVDVDSEQFVEVLKEACEIAGLDPDRALGQTQSPWTKEMRRREGILAAYMELVRTCWTRNSEQLARARKKWLSREIIDRWGIGCAPSLEQLRKKGFKGKDLVALGIAKKSTRDDGWYSHFRDCMVIPFVERGRIVYAVTRRLNDIDKLQQRKPAKGKCLYLPAPHSSSAGISPGLPQPDGFNVDVLRTAEARERGVWLVEACLDAIACTERGQPGIGILRSTPSERLCRRIRRFV